MLKRMSKRMSKRISKQSALALALCAAGVLPALTPATAWADGCYTCGGGSSDSCKDYCRYSGQDTFATRRSCDAKGCKISGTSSCPTAANYKVCLAPSPAPGQGGGTTVASIPWCAAPPRS